MTDLSDRLDALAAEATGGVRLVPLEVAARRRSRRLAASDARLRSRAAFEERDLPGYAQDPVGPGRRHRPSRPGSRRRPILALIAGAVAVATITFLLVDAGSSKSRRLQLNTPPSTPPASTTVLPSTPPASATVPPSTAPASAAVAPLPLACPPPSKTTIPITGAAELKQRVVGTWLLCQGGAVSGMNLFPLGGTGLQILADGTWRKLTRNSAGQLQALPGWNNSGTWTATQQIAGPAGGPAAGPAAGPAQVNFKSASGVQDFERPDFLSAPAMMGLGGLYYVPAAVAVLAAPAVTPSGSEPLEACSLPSQQRAPAPTSQSLIDRVVGTWLVCGTPSVFATDEVGMSIAANKTWTKLTRNAAGQLVPMSGQDAGGTWNVFASDDANIPGPFMLAISFTDGTGFGFTYDLGPVFGSAPATMQVTVVSTSDYEKTTEPVVQATP